MLDFLRVTTKMPKQGIKVVYPKFRIMKSSDLNEILNMIIRKKG